MTATGTLAITARLVQSSTKDTAINKPSKLSTLTQVFQNLAKEAEKLNLTDRANGFRYVRSVVWQKGMSYKDQFSVINYSKRHLTNDLESLKIDNSVYGLGYLSAIKKSIEILQKELKEYI